MAKILVKQSPPLQGKVRISGAKNAALPILAASILSTEDVYLEDVPELKDVEIMCEVLRSLGVKVEKTGKNTLVINGRGLNNCVTDYNLSLIHI